MLSLLQRQDGNIQRQDGNIGGGKMIQNNTIFRCEVEIVWAEESIDEMNKTDNYVPDDKIWLLCW